MPAGSGWTRPPLSRLLLLFVLCLAAAPLCAGSYPPELRFHTVSTDRVSVHFHEGYEAMARETAALATEILAEHEQRYGHGVGHVQIVLVDVEDDSNGFATPLPYPAVTIQAAAPTGDDGFGNHEGWLRLVLSHELAHIVHLDQARGLWRLGRHVFGRAPFLFPNTLAMTWMVEGLATYEETRLTGFGRGRNPDSLMVVRMAALDRRFPGEDQAIYGLDAWPGGETSYLFGERFLRSLAERSGPDAIPRLASQHATQIVPFLDGRTVKKVTGSGLDAQWKAWAAASTDAFEADARARAAEGLTPVRPLTKRGIRQLSPRWSPDGSWIAYTSGTLTRFPEVRLVRPDGSEDHLLALRNGGSGLAWTPDGKRLVLSELQVHRTFSIFSDLSVLDVASGRVHRLTHGARAYDPDVSPDGRRVVFARRLGDHSDLFTIAADGGRLSELTASLPGVEWSGPRWSPGGDAVVASRLLPGGWLDIVRVDARTGAVEQLTHDRAKDVEPTWTADGEAVVFRSDRDGVSNLYALRFSDGALVRLTNVLGGAFDPTLSPDGRSVAFSDYTSRGYDLAVAPVDIGAAAAAAPYVDDHPPPRPDPLPATAPVRPYRAWSMLVPRFWSPWLESDSHESRIGFATGGSDALFHHAWAARGTYGTAARRFNGTGYYVYDRFRPTLVASGQDTTSVFTPSEARGGGREQVSQETRRLDLSAALPVRRTIRSVQVLSLTYRLESEQVLGSARPEERSRLGGFEAAWTLQSARAYPYSISPVEGGRLTVAWMRADRALGSDDTFDKLTADGRYYQRLLGERDVLAVRVVAGTSFSRPLRPPFRIGGYPDSGLFDPGANLVLLRGYETDAFIARRFASANLEYRFPLLSPQRGWRSVPVFLRHLHGTVFLDAADASLHGLRLKDTKTAAGASIGLDTALGYSLPVTGELTVAHGFARSGDTKVYLRFGLAF